MSDSLSSLRIVTSQASGYIDTAARLTFNTASSAYSDGVDFLDQQARRLPLLGTLFPQPEEDAAGAFSRGVQIGVCTMVIGSGLLFAIKLVIAAVSAIVTKAAIGCVAGGAFGLTQHFLHNRMKTQGPEHAALSDAQQSGGEQELGSRNSSVLR